MTYTSIEQSKALIKLGLDEKTADLTIISNDIAPYFHTKESKRGTKEYPCWSAEALLEFLPDDIYTNDTEYYLHTYKEGTKWYIQYTYSFDIGDELAVSEEGELINSLFKIIVWLLTNKLI